MRQGDIVSESATVPKISTISTKEKNDKQDTEKNESIDLRIEQVSREGDLSLR